MTTRPHLPELDGPALLHEVKALQLPPESCAVIGSGVLAVAGIRRARDVDLVVTPKIFLDLQTEGDWEWGEHSTGSYYLRQGYYDISSEWHDGIDKPLALDDLVPDLVWVDGVQMVGLRGILKWKETQLTLPGSRKRHSKDRRDVALIRRHLQQERATMES